MNKFVREHYPVEKLPDDLRPDLPDGTSVTVEIKEEPAYQWAPTPKPMTAKETAELIRKIHEGRTDKGRSAEEIAAEVRSLRDEWDD